MHAIIGNKRAATIAGVTIRVLLGVVFIISAAAKLWSIDQFELYVYSFGFLSLDLSFILARLCIGVELTLGALLVTGWHRRATLTSTALILLFFSIFLGYAALSGRTDSCQCFGQLADMPPAVSLLKNAILLALTLLATKLAMKEQSRRWRLWACIGAAAVGMTLPFVISVPDNWMFGASTERYDEATFNQLIDGKLASRNPREDGKLVAFVTPECPYCRMARQKIDYITQRNNLSPNDIIYVEPTDIGIETFLKTTHGARPLILLLKDGEVVATFHYRNISERKIVGTLATD